MHGPCCWGSSVADVGEGAAAGRLNFGKWTPNELRHSAVSLLSAAGVPIEEIADVVGHDGTRMTTGIYRHVLSPIIGSGAAAMDRLLGDDATEMPPAAAS